LWRNRSDSTGCGVDCSAGSISAAGELVSVTVISGNVGTSFPPDLSGCTAGARTSTGAGRAARPGAQGTGSGSRQPDGRFALGAVPRLDGVPPWVGVPFPPEPRVALPAGVAFAA